MHGGERRTHRPDTILIGIEEPDGTFVELTPLDGRYLSTEAAGGCTGRVIGRSASAGSVHFDWCEHESVEHPRSPTPSCRTTTPSPSASPAAANWRPGAARRAPVGLVLTSASGGGALRSVRFADDGDSSGRDGDGAGEGRAGEEFNAAGGRFGPLSGVVDEEQVVGFADAAPVGPATSGNGLPPGAQGRPRQGGAFHDARRALRGPRMPAGRPAALGGGGRGRRDGGRGRRHAGPTRLRFRLRRVANVVAGGVAAPPLTALTGSGGCPGRPVSGRPGHRVSGGRTDPGSSPCPTPPRSHARTSRPRPWTRRPPRGLGGGSPNRRRGRRRWRST